MDKLWAPWRIKYLRKAAKKGKCIFCSAYKSRSDKSHFVVLRSRYSLVMMNIFPYNNGHLLVAPKRHVSGLAKLNDKETLDLIGLLNKAKALLDKTLKPRGYNIGINIGRVGGAGFPGHVHMHIVPRWEGDTNFMPITSGTKVISQSLQELYKILKYAKK